MSIYSFVRLMGIVSASSSVTKKRALIQHLDT